jgi:peroxiredoxin Q/BCP
MPVELRKRKAVQPAPAPPAKKKSSIVSKVKEAITGNAPKASATATTKVAVGDVVSLESFGGEITTHDGETTSLKKLVDASSAGVVLFTYPKASTPGCKFSIQSGLADDAWLTYQQGTTQACLFRDSYAPLTATGFSIYGLSTDSPKANTTFKEKQKLPYSLLCDPKATLIQAIGLKKSPSGTQRGVFVVDKAGKVLAAEPGGPAATVEVVKKLVGGATGTAVEKDVAKPATNGTNGASELETKKEDIAKADVAADVADTAQKLDSNEPVPA